MQVGAKITTYEFDGIWEVVGMDMMTHPVVYTISNGLGRTATVTRTGVKEIVGSANPLFRKMHGIGEQIADNTNSGLNIKMEDQYHKSVLLDAENIVHGDRHKDYGHPLDDFTKTAALWSVIANAPITPEQVGLMMIALKISRQMHMPKRDNLVDIAGYAETVQMVIDEIDKQMDEAISFGDINGEEDGNRREKAE